jgi:hypothetical protein
MNSFKLRNLEIQTINQTDFFSNTYFSPFSQLWFPCPNNVN